MDLQTIFSTVCNMTITASVVIGCVLLARFALQKAPKGFACALWLVVLFRLMCPVAPSAPVSVLSVVDAPKTEAPVSAVTYVQSPVQAPLESLHADPSLGMEGVPSPRPAEPVVDWHLIASYAWAAGVIALTAYGILSYVNLKRKLRESVPIGPGLREADSIRSPFLLGFLLPVIYLPSGLNGPERSHILLHERCHLRHGDHLVKAAFWLAVCLHWFNPLAWLAFVLSGRDMEMRCDEAVLRKQGQQIRSDYAQSLLNFATGRPMAPAPLAFGEGDTGKRVKHVLGWKQKAAWVMIPAAILCTVVLLITAVNPGGWDTPFGHSYRIGSIRTSSEKPTAVSGDTLYTLTSDQGLFVRGEKTELVGFFRKGSADWEDIRSMPEYMKEGDLRRCWRIAEEDWWLLELEDGTLWLFDGSDCLLCELVRTDLLGVSIKQPGVEAYVEPVWYRTEAWNWMTEEMSETLLRGDAQIVLMPETDVDKIMVEEEYHDYSGEAAGVIVSHRVLEPDANGDFLLDVPNRDSEEGNFSVYRVTVGEDHYIFRVRFSAPEGSPVEEPTQAVTFTQDNAFITLQIPESWGYSILSPDAEEIDAGITGGISFWPRGRAEGKIFFGYYPDIFAVCGTGLESTAMTLAGQTASVGTYDDHEVWDFIRFSDHFAVWGQGHEAWWAEYGEEAMKILDSAVFSEAGIDLSDYPEGDVICTLPESPTEPQ